MDFHAGLLSRDQRSVRTGIVITIFEGGTGKNPHHSEPQGQGWPGSAAPYMRQEATLNQQKRTYHVCDRSRLHRISVLWNLVVLAQISRLVMLQMQYTSASCLAEGSAFHGNHDCRAPCLCVHHHHQQHHHHRHHRHQYRHIITISIVIILASKRAIDISMHMDFMHELDAGFLKAPKMRRNPKPLT